ncbi:SLATT domain-containing protein [Flexivirga oryzae]|uniref:SMODS and SLOG-associating 2TM effector domain-containing protein n=1 Tax=Flexivirga oryzae TaxID=1794944 RepID=A0A839NFK4_9MICO|nr:SLATT domain-containing protein [Flexivirga oryzae]MBB2893461.1 hypothetical protein [Flexivirga oryzae]
MFGHGRRQDVGLLGGGLTQTTGDVERALNELHGAVVSKIEEVDRWYLSDKRRKRVASRTLRAFAILLTALGSIWPLAISASSTSSSPSWGYAFLAAAGASIAFDRFFGLSLAWMRDLAAHEQIRALHTQFVFDWAQECLASTGQSDVGARLSILRSVAEDLGSIVSSETATWTVQLGTLVDSLERSVSPLGGEQRGAGADTADR